MFYYLIHMHPHLQILFKISSRLAIYQSLSWQLNSIWSLEMLQLTSVNWNNIIDVWSSEPNSIILIKFLLLGSTNQVVESKIVNAKFFLEDFILICQQTFFNEVIIGIRLISLIIEINVCNCHVRFQICFQKAQFHPT